jgi:hypothetical protein
MKEALNMTPKLKRPSKSELINGVEQAPNGIPNEKKGRVGGRRTRGIRAKEEKECGLGILHRLFTAAANK